MKHRKSATRRGTIAAVALIVAAGLAALAFVSYRSVSTLNQLKGALASGAEYERDAQVARLTGDLASLSTTPSTLEAFRSLAEGYDAYIPAHLRDTYVELNPFRDGDMTRWVDPKDGSRYTAAHAKHHRWLRIHARNAEYQDIWLIRNDGHVIYSLRKGRRFATEMPTEPSTDGLQQAFRKAQASALEGSVHFSDEQESLIGERVFYASAPLLDEKRSPVGALVVRRKAWNLAHFNDALARVRWSGAEARTEGYLLAGAFGLLSLLVFGVLYGRATQEAQLETVRAARGPLPSPSRADRPGDAEATGGRARLSGTRPVLTLRDNESQQKAPLLSSRGSG